MRRNDINVFKALGDPNRVRIMKMLEKRELCVCEVREVLDLSVSTVSKHLTILRNAGLVIDTKDGKWVNFRLNDKSEHTFIRSVIRLLYNSFNDDEVVREDNKKVRKVSRNTICNV